jgi:WD40 repeat protein
MHKIYAIDIKIPKLILGLSNSWGLMELVIQNKSAVQFVMLSPNGSRVVSGSDDKTVHIWNATTGEVEAELEGHTDWVWSVAFSQDGNRVVSGSFDKIVQIWNTTTGVLYLAPPFPGGLHQSPGRFSGVQVDSRYNLFGW